MVNISLDLETWGTRPGCDIRSIGAVVFDPVAGTVSDDTFYIACRNPIQVRFGGPKETEDSIYADMTYRKWYLHRDPETVKWWSEQSAEAQAAFENPVDLREALRQFTIWLNILCSPTSVPPSGGHTNLKLWANDPHFDVSILEAAYHAVGLPAPWHYRAPRSMRTATDLAGLARDEYVTHGTAHNALDDAIAQAWTICKCYERLGLTR